MKGPTRHSYTEVEVMHRRRCTSNSMDVSECLASHHHLFQSCMRPKTHTTGDVNTNSAWCGRWVLLALVGSHLLIVVHLCMPNALGYSGVHTDCEGDCLALSSEYCSRVAYMLAWSIKTFLLLQPLQDASRCLRSASPPGWVIPSQAKEGRPLFTPRVRTPTSYSFYIEKWVACAQ